MDPYQLPANLYWEDLTIHEPLLIEIKPQNVQISLADSPQTGFPGGANWQSSTPPAFHSEEDLGFLYYYKVLGMLIHPESRSYSRLDEIQYARSFSPIYDSDAFQVRLTCLEKWDRDKQRWEHPSGIANWKIELIKEVDRVCLEAQVSTIVVKRPPFIELNRENLEKAFSKLTEATQAQWGYMTAQHLVEHFEYFYQMALGTIPGEILITEEMIPKYQNSLWNYKPLPVKFQHPYLKKEVAEDLRYGSLQEAKAAFWKSYTEVEAYFRDNPKGKLMVSMFGMLDRYHWYLQNRKHFTHHFQQFGIF